MYDFSVIVDKINSFDNPDELAFFLMDNEVKAWQGNSMSCAISEFVSDQTGERVKTGSSTIGIAVPFVNELDENNYEVEYLTEESHLLSPAAQRFIQRFDAGFYPELVVEGHYDDYRFLYNNAQQP